MKKPDPDDPRRRFSTTWSRPAKACSEQRGWVPGDAEEFDKDNIPTRYVSLSTLGPVGHHGAAQVIKKVGPYIENPDFTPKMIEKASVACKAICMCDLGVLKCCGAFTLSCPSHTMPGVVSFSSLRPFGPSRNTRPEALSSGASLMVMTASMRCRVDGVEAGGTPSSRRRARIEFEAVRTAFDADAPRRWAHAMHTYHFVALGVAPKKAKLAEAQAELEEATGVLNEARAKLAAVVEKLEKNRGSSQRCREREEVAERQGAAVQGLVEC